jgi:hypothetical protein
MRKGLFLKLSMAALVGVVGFSPAAFAQLGGSVTTLEPAGVLIMPYDETASNKSFQIVSRTGGADAGLDLATHWSYWSKDCEHLADVFICLTPQDTVVVDPTVLQNEVQNGNENQKIGGIIDLTGTRGMVTVQAFEAGSGAGCQILDPEAVVENQLVGGWVIANVATSSAYGTDAIGLNPDTDFPDAATLLDPASTQAGVKIQSFNPSTLEDSEIILLAIERSEESGNGLFQGFEIGPIPRTFELANGDRAAVCCDVAYVDNVEARISLPDFCFGCVGFEPLQCQGSLEPSCDENNDGDITDEDDDTPVVPSITTLDAPGFVHLTNCVTLTDLSADGTTTIGPIGTNLEQFLFAYHGQAVGPFGTVVSGKYTNANFL